MDNPIIEIIIECSTITNYSDWEIMDINILSRKQVVVAAAIVGYCVLLFDLKSANCTVMIYALTRLRREGGGAVQVGANL